MASTRIKKRSKGYSYKYTELSTIHEELEKQGITYYQYTEFDNNSGADYIMTVLTVDGEEKPARRGCRVILGELKGGNAAQQQGSGLTYARRYSLLMALGWATEDDDGASVGKTSAKTERPKQTADDVISKIRETRTIDQLQTLWEKLGGWQQNAQIQSAKEKQKLELRIREKKVAAE